MQIPFFFLVGGSGSIHSQPFFIHSMTAPRQAHLGGDAGGEAAAEGEVDNTEAGGFFGLFRLWS